MSTRYNVTRGTRYAVGASLPFFVSKAMAKSWAESHGFVDVVVRDRGATLSYDPKRAAGYSDDWNTAMELTYNGAASSVELPGKAAWIVELEHGLESYLPKPKSTPATSSSSSPAYGTKAIGLFVLLYFATRGRR